MKGKAFDRQTNPSALVGVSFYNKRYFIVQRENFASWYRKLEWLYAKSGVLSEKVENGFATYKAAMKHAKLYSELHFAYRFVGFVHPSVVCGSYINQDPFEIILTIRRFEHENYVFKAKMTHFTPTHEWYTYILCETPVNTFGYTDIVLFTDSGNAQQQYRNDTPNWILKKLEKEYSSLVQYLQVWETPSELKYSEITKELNK